MGPGKELEQGKRQDQIVFQPWEISVTGDWSPDTGIFHLRDKSAEELVKLLWPTGIYVQNSAIVELIAHGNPRKAAEFARKLIKAHPIAEKSIKKGFGEMAAYLLETPLQVLPSSPSEYPSDVSVILA